MSTPFFVVLIVLAMGATVFALVRGIIAFLRTTEADLKGDGPSIGSQRQNKAMTQRVIWQAAAIVLVVLLAVMAGRT